jgi:hypothetical protein
MVCRLIIAAFTADVDVIFALVLVPHFGIGRRGDTGSPVTVPITSPIDTGIPLMPGHFSTVDLFGFTAPGVWFQLQVVQL